MNAVARIIPVPKCRVINKNAGGRRICLCATVIISVEKTPMAESTNRVKRAAMCNGRLYSAARVAALHSADVAAAVVVDSGGAEL